MGWKAKVSIASVVLTAIGLSLAQLWGVRVTASLSGCPLESPISISVTNYTFSRVARLSIVLEGWKGGVSENILASNRYRFSYSIPPFETRTACYSDDAFTNHKSSIGYQGREGRWVDTDAIINASNRFIQLAEGVELVVADYEVTFL